MDKLMIRLPLLTPRAEYIFTLMIRDLMGADMIMTTSQEEYLSYPGPRLEYDMEPIGDGIFICSSGLLAEQSLHPLKVEFIRFKDYPAFFPLADDRSAFPFDLFAAAFYLVTCYEEYLPFEPDKYGRFRDSGSAATTGKFLDIPIVNIWTNLLKDHIRKVYPAIKFREKKFRFVPTVDIDHAYAFSGRTLYRTLGGYGRSLLDGDLKKMVQRTAVLLGYRNDPYNQFEYIRAIHDQYGLNPLYFVLFADYGKNDNNVTLTGKRFRLLLRKLDNYAVVGIHPSLTSGKSQDVLDLEISRLSGVLGHQINTSRQHFLSISFPETYRRLVKHGITDDYSMGYAGAPGFRAGIADPFPFFDLSSNRQENLLIHPAALMDVTMRDYGKASPSEAIRLCRSYADTIKAVEGEFVSVWHNESFDESGRWKGWRNVYEDLLAYTR